MMKNVRELRSSGFAGVVLATFLLALPLAGCDRNQGPFEEAGEKMDEAATDFGNSVEDACEDMKEGMNAEDKDC